MRESDVLSQLTALLDRPAGGPSHGGERALAQSLVTAHQQLGEEALPDCAVVPFVTGRRPTDEIAYPGLGSSDDASLIWSGGERRDNRTYILFAVTGLERYTPEERDALALDVTLSFAGSDGSLHAAPIPGWNRRPLAPAIFAAGARGRPETQTIALSDAAARNLVLALPLESILLPGAGWDWAELDALVRDAATDAAHPFTFGHMFSQMLTVSLRLTGAGVPLASAQAMVDVYDARRSGSLYQRIVERLIKPDTARQARAAGLAELDHAYHPWYPVLLIGSEKADLYMGALAEDIVDKGRHLTNPRWLVRVGLYLELLTCLGVFEAVRADVGDLLSPAERAAFEASPLYAEIRGRLNPEGWRRVWELREIALPQFGIPQTGPVSAQNLLQKKRATLAFLEVHHEDLKHAIALAGGNEYNAQETWHRVFRDAERAVLRKTPQAFPELASFAPWLRQLVLWQKKGGAGDGESGLGLRQAAGFISNQDGLYASACNQYRASMNEVAGWAKAHGLMDYTGGECVPVQVSLLHAFMAGRTEQVERLQLRDGYAASLDAIVKLPEREQGGAERVLQLLCEVAIFNVLTDDERRHLAATARPIALGPLERIIIEGRRGSSLFVVGSGRLEVLIRQPDGTDRQIDIKERGAVVGELSLLTGAPRAATVRALEGAVVYEIGKQQYAPIIRARPELIDELSAVMAQHSENIDRHRRAYDSEQRRVSMRARIHRFFFS